MLKPISKYYWWCQISGWSFWVALNVILAIYYGRPLKGIYFANLVVMGVSGILITHLLREVVLHYHWLEFPLDKLIVRLLLTVVICAALITLIRGSVNLIFHLSEKDEKFYSIGILIVSSVLVTAWTAIYFLWHFFQKDQQYTLDRLRMQSLVNDLELRTIKSQLNPHFLFNALNSIRALIDENPQRARTAVTELSNILRSSMQAEKAATVSLENELNIVRDYLALEHIRFEERLKVHYDIDPNTLELPVPPMMLQTLVENAIKHGISKSVEGGILNISSQIKGIQHIITIRNTGQINGYENTEGFGLKSTKQRLGLLYKHKANFEIGNLSDHIVEVKVSIDL